MAITAPVYPSASMRVKLEVSRGVNQLQQSMGTANSLYVADNSITVKESVDLIANGIYHSNPNETINTLVITTSEPLTLNGTDANGNFVVINISKMLVYDSTLASFVLANTTSNRARIQIYTVKVQNDLYAESFYYGSATPPSVYNSAFVLSLTAVQGVKNRSFSATAGNGQKVYYCYPDSFGLSNFAVNGFTGGFVLKGDVPVITPQGTFNYYVYESDNAGLGAIDVTVTDA